MKNKLIQIVGSATSGMAQDISIVEQEFMLAGLNADITPIKKLELKDRIIRKFGFHWYRHKAYQFNVFIQQAESWWMPDAVKNYVIPNQEWFTPYGVALLPKVDEVWCKTHEAERIFSELGCKCIYLGFTSRDRKSDKLSEEKSYRKFLHIGA